MDACAETKYEQHTCIFLPNLSCLQREEILMCYACTGSLNISFHIYTHKKRTKYLGLTRSSDHDF